MSILGRPSKSQVKFHNRDVVKFELVDMGVTIM
jgi:hypothetical protein